jgi:hypothetical protein
MDEPRFEDDYRPPRINWDFRVAHSLWLMSTDEVERNLRMAAWTMLRLSGTGVDMGFALQNLRAVPDPTLAYGYGPTKVHRIRPSAVEISHMDHVSRWYALVPEDKRVVRRVLGLSVLWDEDDERLFMPRARIARAVGCTPRSVGGWYRQGLQLVLGGLMARDQAPRVCLYRLSAEQARPISTNKLSRRFSGISGADRRV